MRPHVFALAVLFLAGQTQATTVTTETVLATMDQVVAVVGIPAVQAYAFVRADSFTTDTAARSRFKTDFAVAYAQHPNDIRGIFGALKLKAEKRFVLKVFEAILRNQAIEAENRRDALTEQADAFSSAALAL